MGLTTVTKLKIIRNKKYNNRVEKYSGAVLNVGRCSKEQASFVTIAVTVLLINLAILW